MTPFLVDELLDPWLPRRCLLCGLPPEDARHSWCPGCLADLPWIRAGCSRCGLPFSDVGPRPAAGARCGRCPPTLADFDRVWSALVYEYPVDRLIAAAKFGGRLEVARGLGALLARGAPSPVGPAVLLPVPLHWRREAARGFNQAEEIARGAARPLGVMVSARLCRRSRATVEQVRLSARARRRNPGGMFRAPARLDGLHVVLVDDVLTTGATAQAIGAVLRSAGAERVELWTVARTLPP